MDADTPAPPPARPAVADPLDLGAAVVPVSGASTVADPLDLGPAVVPVWGAPTVADPLDLGPAVVRAASEHADSSLELESTVQPVRTAAAASGPEPVAPPAPAADLMPAVAAAPAPVIAAATGPSLVTAPAASPGRLGDLVVGHFARLEAAMLSRVLTTTLAGSLPASMIAVERRRSLGERLSGKPGAVIGVVITADDRELAYRAPDVGVIEASVSHVVRGVVLSRHSVSPAEWLDALAETLNAITDRDRETRERLRAYVATPPG